MELLELTAENFSKFGQAAIALNDEFLIDIDESSARTQEEKEAILSDMIARDAPSHVFLLVDESGEPIGTCYVNFGKGYSAGGVGSLDQI